MIKSVLIASLLLISPIAAAQSDDMTIEEFSALMDEIGFSPEFYAVAAVGLTYAEADAVIAQRVRSVDELDVFLKLVRAGHRRAQRQLGIECLIASKCPVTRKEAHDALVSAARTDMDAAVSLAGIYRNGRWGGQAYPVDAARWFIHADSLGYELAGLELATLPRAAVIEAGGERFLMPLPVEEPVAALPELKPLREVMAAREAAFEVYTRDGTALSVGVNTSFSDVGDAAASCYVATWYGLMGFKEMMGARAGGLPVSELIPVVSDAAYAKASDREKVIIKVTYRDMTTAASNGGISNMEEISANFREHGDLLHSGLNRLPTAAACNENYLAYAGFVRQQSIED